MQSVIPMYIFHPYLEWSVVNGTGDNSSRQRMLMLLQGAQLLHNVWLLLLLQQVEVLLLLLVVELVLGVAHLLLLKVGSMLLLRLL